MSTKKQYSNGEVTVVWQPHLCIHSANCVNGLPQVFKPQEKPWIQVTEAISEDIVATVNRCPSGALSTYWNNKLLNPEQQTTMDKTQVEVLADGPLMVKGELTIKKPDG